MSKPFAGQLHQMLSRFSAFYWLAKTQLIYRPAFGQIGRRSKIIHPLTLRNMENIFIGDNVIIARDAWLFTLKALENKVPKMSIGNGCKIGNYNHLTCVNEVRLGEKVITADRVHISDNSHNYQNPQIPIMDQSVISKGPVSIGTGTWIGENVSVLSCNIGRNCVVGANAVVIHHVPDFCVVAGIPAKVIRKYNPTSQQWERND